MAQTESNNSLYFIVGGIVVALVIGFFIMRDGSVDFPSHNASTTASTAVKTTTDADTDTSRTDIQINENGASITQSKTE
jgi:hypothetical protein